VQITNLTETCQYGYAWATVTVRVNRAGSYDVWLRDDYGTRLNDDGVVVDSSGSFDVSLPNPEQVDVTLCGGVVVEVGGAFCGCCDDATPPLVAASPVPPVVPDSEALSSLPTSMLRPDDGAWYDKDDPDDNPPQVVPELLALAQRIRGSGVVPDKPALALCAQHGGIGYCSPLCPNASVPAVTDDEAATEAIRTLPPGQADDLPRDGQRGTDRASFCWVPDRPPHQGDVNHG
jgi:hypothetical protein